MNGFLAVLTMLGAFGLVYLALRAIYALVLRTKPPGWEEENIREYNRSRREGSDESGGYIDVGNTMQEWNSSDSWHASDGWDTSDTVSTSD